MQEWLETLENYLQLLQVGAYAAIVAAIMSIASAFMCAFILTKVERIEKNGQKWRREYENALAQNSYPSDDWQHQHIYR